MKNRNLTTVMITALCCLTMKMSKAQDYKTAIGVRTGFTSGLTFKHFIKSDAALEAMVGIRPYNSNFTFMYEKYNGTSVPELNWYYGGGAHVTFYNRGIEYGPWHKHYWKTPDYYNYNAFGVDLTLGLEYKIPKAPLALSFDIKPFFEFYPYNRVYTSLDPGLGIKLAF